MGKFVCGTSRSDKMETAFKTKAGVEILNSTKATRYVEFLNVLMGDLVIDMYSKRNTTKDSILSLGDSQTIRNIYDQLKPLFINNKFYDGATQEAKDDLNTIYQNWDAFANYHSRYNGFIKLSLDFDYTSSDVSSSEDVPESGLDETALPDDADIEIEEREKGFEPPSNKLDEYEAASDELRLLLRFIPMVKSEMVGEHRILTEDFKEDGLPQQSDYLNIMKLIMDKTKGVRDQDKFFDIVTSPAMHNIVPEIEILNRVLGFDDLNNLNSKQVRLLTDFYILFSRPYNPVFSSKKVLTEDSHVHMFFKNTKGNLDKILANFKVSFQTRTIRIGDEQYIRVDNSVLDDGGRSKQDDYGYGRKRLYAVPPAFKPINLTEEEVDEMTIDELKETYAEHLAFINLLGIQFSGLDLLSTTQEKISFIKEVLNKASTMRNELAARIDGGQYIFHPLEDVEKPFWVPNKGAKGPQVKLQPYDLFTKAATQFESKYSRFAPTFVSKTAEGNNQNNITLANVFNIALDSIINSETEDDFLATAYYEHFDKRNPQYENSFTRRNVIAPEDIPLTLTTGNYNAYQVEGTNEFKASTRKLTFAQKYVNDFGNMMLYGAVNTPQLERKSSYYFFRYLDKEGKGVLPIKTDMIAGNFTSNVNFFQQVLFYIHGEVMRAKTYPESIGKHKNINAFSQFDYMADLLKPLKESSEEALSALFDHKSDLSQSLRPAVEKYFNERLQDHINTIQVEGIDLRTLIPDRLLDKVSEYEKGVPLADLRIKYRDNFLKAFIANTYIMNTEFIIFVGGNPVLIKDYHKRLGGVASTGIQPSTIEAIYNYLLYSPEELKFFDNYSLRGVLNGSEDYDTQSKRDNSLNFQSAVIPEIKSNSNKYTDPQTILDYIDSVKRKSGVVLTKAQAAKELLVENISNPQGGIAVGDGQGYVNLDFHRELAKTQGVYREEHEVSYVFEALTFKKDILKIALTENEKTTYRKSLETIINKPEKYALPTLKQSYYGPLANESVTVDGKVFDKFSLFPLLPSYVANVGNAEMLTLLKTMAERQIGYVKFQSGSKNFTRKVVPINKLGKEEDLDLLQTELLKLQITPPTEEKIHTLIPTQKIKLLFANLFNNGVASTPEIQALRDEFIDILKNTQEANKKEVLAGLGFNDSGEWDLGKLVGKIEQQITNQKLPIELLDALEIDPISGGFKYPLEASGVYKQVIDHILGFVDKKLRKFDVNGGDFVLVAPAMLNFKLKHYVYGKDRVSETECALALTKEYVKLLNLPDPRADRDADVTIDTIERLNELLNDKDFVKNNKAALTVSFSRPPVDGQHSMGTAIVKKFLFPTVGNILVLPEEYLHQAGIDFDYDKEKVFIPNLSNDGLVFTNVDEVNTAIAALEDEYKEFAEFHSKVGDYLDEAESYEEYQELKNEFLGSDFFTNLFRQIFGGFENRILEDKLEEKVKDYLFLRDKKDKHTANKLLAIFNKVLTLPEVYSELIIPSNTETATALAVMNAKDLKDVPGYIPAILPTGSKIYDYLENQKVFKVFNEAAELLGVFALSNTMRQVLAQHDIQIPQSYDYIKGVPNRYINLLTLSEEEQKQVVKDGRISITNRTNIAGEINQHLESEWISITVDAAKDPKFADLLISFNNVNTMLFMMDLGYPSDRIIDTINTAVIRRFVKLKKGGMSSDTAFNYILRNDLGINSKVNEGVIIGIDGRKQSIPVIDKRLKAETKLITNLKEYKTHDLKALTDAVEISDTIKLLANFIAMEDHASKSMTFKNLFKNDTTKVSSLFEILGRKDKRSIVINSKMFTEAQIAKIEKDSLVTPYRNDEFIEEIIKQISPIYSQPLVLKSLSNLFNKRKSESAITSAILSSVLTGDFLTFNLLALGLHTDKDGVEHKFYDYAKNLVVRKRNKDKSYSTIFLDRLTKLRNDPSYAEMKLEFPVLDLIQGVISSKVIKKNDIYNGSFAHNVQLNIPANAPLIATQSYKAQFKRIFEGDYDFKNTALNAALKEFVQDFFIAGMLQSGFNKSRLNFYDYAPITFTQGFLQPALKRFDNADKETKEALLSFFELQFLKNNKQYYSNDVISKNNAQEYTYLGKYYGTEPALSVGNLRYLSKTPVAPAEPTTPDAIQDAPSLPPAEYTNHSGGAEGGDESWDSIGQEFGVTNHKHYREPASARDSKSQPGLVDSSILRDRGVKSVDLEESEFPGVYAEGKDKATDAARQMGRIEETFNVRSNYIIRNWAQVKYADAIYAIGVLIDKGAALPYDKIAKVQQVKGGTGYAVQMAINERKPVFVYDGTKNSWFTYDYTANEFVKTATPKLTKNFAGIGSRKSQDWNKDMQAIRDVYANTFGVNKSNDIYSQLGDKTVSENVVIQPWANLKNAKVAITEEGVIATRIVNSNEHFGNIYSHEPAEKAQGLIKTESIKEAVEKYAEWVINSTNDRAQWIRKQLQSGELKGKSILYYKELGEPSHATALDYLINKYDWSKSIAPTQTTSVKVSVSNEPYTKDTPNDKTRGFFFTENLQAYLANRGRLNEERSLPQIPVTLNVTATNNQAGIRTNSTGYPNKNSFAIISKKYQQTSERGAFVKQEGQFQDTEEDFELFKKYNTEAIQEAAASGLPLTISSGGIATGKSALPQRFVSWLAGELTNNLNITGDIVKNTVKGYDGYGLTNLKVIETAPSKIEILQPGFGVFKNGLTEEVPTTTGFTYKDKTIPTQYVLGSDQVEALKKLVDFADSRDIDIITLQGAAGTGKTSIIGYLQAYLGKKYSFAYMAPTHAAVAELAFATVKTGNNKLPSTLASSLTSNNESGGYKFTTKVANKLGANPIIVLDEVSMIDASDLQKLESAIEDLGGKLIMMGDEKQISKVVKGNAATKQVSPAFTIANKINLNKVFRQKDNALLALLSKLRNQTEFKLFKVANSDNLKFVNRRDYNRELIADLENDPLNTVVISYTNNAVKATNISARKILGREGQTVVGDIVMGYLGYASKQIEKADIANSIPYVITNIIPDGSVKLLEVESDKLAKLRIAGITGITANANTRYHQLSNNDSLTFDDLTEEDFERNNRAISDLFKSMHQTNEKYAARKISYPDYLSFVAAFANTLRKYSVGSDYIYNPLNDRMEVFDPLTHAKIKKDGQGSLLFNKDIDYGHAITIHKSQGASIGKVYFDTGSLKSATNTPIVDAAGNQITTEKLSLLYVAMSRSSEKLVVYEADNVFEMLQDETPTSSFTAQSTDTKKTGTIKRSSSNGVINNDSIQDHINNCLG